MFSVTEHRGAAHEGGRGAPLVPEWHPFPMICGMAERTILISQTFPGSVTDGRVDSELPALRRTSWP